MDVQVWLRVRADVPDLSDLLFLPDGSPVFHADVYRPPPHHRRFPRSTMDLGTSKGDRGEQDQRHDERKKGGDRLAYKTCQPAGSQLVLRNRVWVHSSASHSRRTQKRSNNKYVRVSPSRRMQTVSTQA